MLCHAIPSQVPQPTCSWKWVGEPDYAIPWNTMQYHGIPCNTMECHAIPWNAIQYHTIPCNMAERHTRLLEQTYFTYYGGFPITNIDQKSHEYENWKLKSFWLPMSWSSLQFQYEAEYFLPDPISSPHLHLRCPLNREFSSNWCLSQCEWFHIIEFSTCTYSNGFLQLPTISSIENSHSWIWIPDIWGIPSIQESKFLWTIKKGKKSFFLL